MNEQHGKIQTPHFLSLIFTKKAMFIEVEGGYGLNSIIYTGKTFFRSPGVNLANLSCSDSAG